MFMFSSIIFSPSGLSFSLRTDILQSEILIFLPRNIPSPHIAPYTLLCQAKEQLKSLLFNFLKIRQVNVSLSCILK